MIKLPLASALVRAVMALALIAMTPSAFANTSGRMDTYFSNALGSASVTGPTAYRGQSMGYYTMGNLSMRAPQANLQLAGVQLPSIKAGCGGIDIFTGGFSFVNSAQLVAEMKAIASNAEGYAFNYALKHLCPSCADVLTQLQDFAQKINSSNISSCQATNAMLNSVFDRSEATNHQLCSELGTGHGYFSDMVDGWYQCESNSASQLSTIDPNNTFVATKKNLAWEAIKNVPYLSNDQEFSSLVMTLTGTVIENCTGDTEGSCKYTVIQPAADEKSMIGALLDGGTVLGVQCDETVNCLNPNPLGYTFNIAQSSGFKAKVTAAINDIVLRVLSRTPLTQAEQNFLQFTPVPVLKMARVYATSQGVLAQNTLNNYADLIATVTALYFVDDAIHQIDAGARNLIGVDKDQLQEWTDKVAQLQSTLHAREATAAQEESAYEVMLDRTQKVEAALAGDYQSRFAQSYAFASSMSAH